MVSGTILVTAGCALTVETSNDRVGRVASDHLGKLQRARVDLVVGDNLVDHAKRKCLRSGDVAASQDALNRYVSVRSSNQGQEGERGFCNSHNVSAEVHSAF